MTENKFNDKIYKIVLGGLLLGWFIKLPVFFWEYLNVTAFKFRPDLELFPSIFESPIVSQLFYFLPLTTLSIYFMKSGFISELLLKIYSSILCLSSLVLMLHLNTYNDATFVTSFWVSLWLLWFSFHGEQQYHQQACKLAVALVSMIFLGGLVGKLSSEWFSGEVMFGLLQSTFNHWPFSWIKDNFTYEQMKTFSLILSWGVILIELLLASSFFWPLKYSLKIIPAIIAGIIFFRTWLILSVITSLTVLIFACYKLYKNELEYQIEEA